MTRLQKSRFGMCAGVASALLLLPELVHAVENPVLPTLSINVGGSETGTDGTITTTLRILFMLSALTFVPAMMITMTCFTRIAVVLSLTRQAIGTMTLPPNMVITGLALFLTFAIMGPVFNQMYTEGVRPYMAGEMADSEALTKTLTPIKKFMVRNAREKDLALFLEITQSEPPQDMESVPFHVAVPAFVLTELYLAFQIGFLIALPFLVLDIVVSSILTSMSMITLPPVVISLPLKLMLFVIVDGWHLIIASLMKTYQLT